MVDVLLPSAIHVSEAFFRGVGEVTTLPITSVFTITRIWTSKFAAALCLPRAAIWTRSENIGVY